jgi:four helix bundle protein
MGNVLKDKSFRFALRIVRLARFLSSNRKEYVLNKQLLRSGTSIGALISEAEFAQSKSDFVHKLSIALKEANETRYWLKLLHCGDYLTEKMYKSLLPDIDELIKLLVSSIKTAKSNIKANM